MRAVVFASGWGKGFGMKPPSVIEREDSSKVGTPVEMATYSDDGVDMLGLWLPRSRALE
jgi:hypothetical protein